MADTSRFDTGQALRLLGEAQRLPDQPGALFEAADGLCQHAVGHRLFTLLAWRPATGEVARVYSSRPQDYPLGGRKPMGPTQWGAHVLHGAAPWLGQTPEDIVWAFPDHALIASLGCGACMSVPICWKGTVLGVVSVLDAEGAYDAQDLAGLALIAPLLVPGFLSLSEEI